MPFHFLSRQVEFPDPSSANEDGLVAIGGDLKPERLIESYSKGIFPWYSEGQPILWFSPDPRMVLYPNKFKCSNSLRRTINANQFEIRVDSNFTQVIQECSATPRSGQDGTWITSEMIDAYIQMHQLGYAHSFETYREGTLVGGLYGLSLGSSFFGESMFHKVADASKFALSHLVTFTINNGFRFIDAQTPTAHLHSLGAEEVERSQFMGELKQALKQKTLLGRWAL